LRILLYNWAPAAAPVSDGGGVGLYLENVIEALTAGPHEVFVLTSGFRYGILGSKPHFVRRRGSKPGARFYDLVNSPVVAPSFMMFPDPTRTVDCPELVALFRAFLRRHGPFDIVHIHNVEGISLDVLQLRAEFPTTHFLLTNHNYGVICQQANLWRQDKERCTSFQDGARCHACDRFGPATDRLVIDRFIRWNRLDRAHTRVRNLAARLCHWVLKLRRLFERRLPWDPAQSRTFQGRRIGPADAFSVRRARAMELVNANCSAVLSVSAATERILLAHGLDPKLSRVSYIGTRHYDSTRARAPKPASGPLRLAFLGYTRPDKGFHFLVDAIEAMPERLEGRFSLTVAARISDPAAVARLEGLSGRLAALTIRNGYRQEELPALLAETDLGLVLPLWDDALPQVAIEFVCHGVPILVTDRGGQQELAADPAFIFPAESRSEFWKRLERISDDRSELERFWSAPRPLRTNTEHAAELLEIYRSISAAVAAAEVAPPQDRIVLAAQVRG
jgi:glycosyltransferase involved in cell wall biosynthesis